MPTAFDLFSSRVCSPGVADCRFAARPSPFEVSNEQRTLCAGSGTYAVLTSEQSILTGALPDSSRASSSNNGMTGRRIGETGTGGYAAALSCALSSSLRGRVRAGAGGKPQCGQTLHLPTVGPYACASQNRNRLYPCSALHQTGGILNTKTEDGAQTGRTGIAWTALAGVLK